LLESLERENSTLTKKLKKLNLSLDSVSRNMETNSSHVKSISEKLVVKLNEEEVELEDIKKF